jgi:hypothetical protein
MPPDPPLPKDRAREIALSVDRLYHENPARWKKQWAVAVRDEEEWHARREAAEKRREEAGQAIRRERDAIQAGGNATPHLTDLEAQPGEGWRREHVDILDPETGLPMVYVHGWMPPSTEKWSEGEWPGCNPSLSAMYLELAVLHGGVLETSATILDSATARSKAVGVIMVRNFGDGPSSPWRVRECLDDVDGPFRARCSHRGMDRAQTFLNAVEADLAKQSGRGGAGATKDAPQPLATKKRTRRPPLTGNGAAVLKLLEGLPPEGAMTGPEILTALNGQTPAVRFDQSTFYRHIVPVLKKHYGVKNKPRVGYYLSSKS